MREALQALARRARFVAAREAFLDAFFWTSFAAASVLLADRVRLEWRADAACFSGPREIAVALVAAALLASAAALSAAVRTRPDPADVALAADRRLGLSDSLATAHEGAAGAFTEAVRGAPERALAGAPTRRVFPSPPVGARGGSAGAVIAALLLLLVPLPAERRAAEIARNGTEEGLRDSGPEGMREGAGERQGDLSAGGGGRGSERARAPSPPLFGEPERARFKERPVAVEPLVGDGDWRRADALVDAGAAADGAPGEGTEAARRAAYRKQAEAFVGRDGFPPEDRRIVESYFDRALPR